MITYNHAKFIAQAIESVLMQQAPFPFELVIGEDCSTDGTRAIVEHYARLRPDIVRPLLHATNQGMHKNFSAVVQECRGEFIACLEGDDYWTDSSKIAQQVAVLDVDARIAVSFHPAEGIDGNGAKLGWRWPSRPPATTLSRIEVIAESVLTVTVMFRSSLLSEEDLVRISKYPVGDYPMLVTCCRNGGMVHFLDDCMAAYRRHPGGITSRLGSGGTFHLKMAEMWRVLATPSQLASDAAVRLRIWQLYYSASRHFTDEGEFRKAQTALADSLRFADMPLAAIVKSYLRCLARIVWMRLSLGHRKQ